MCYRNACCAAAAAAPQCAAAVRPSAAVARVLLAEDGELTARTHLLLRVEVDGDDWLVDAGFGSLTPTVPLRLHDPQPQATPHERYRLRRLPSDGDFVLSAESSDGWRAMHRFDLQAPAPIDNVVGNWYVCTHPDSSFPASCARH